MNINFDNNAMSNPTRHVLSVLRNVYKKRYNNPSSIYLDGIRSMNRVEIARNQIANALGCDTYEIFFTSGASESNSWVSKNYNLDVDTNSHNSILMSNQYYLPNKKTIKAFPYVVSETGYNLYNNKFNNKYDKYLDNCFVDLTQAIGKYKIDLHKNKQIGFASASGQKFGGILGCGILYVRKDLQNNFEPLIYGTQERGFRGGTLNFPAIICFGKAIADASQNINCNNKKIHRILDYIIKNIDNKNIKFRSSSNVLNITFNKLLGQSAVQIFDKYGINISAGSACSSEEDSPSQAYLNLGLTEEEALRTIRISVGSYNTIRQAKKFVKVIGIIIDKYEN